jgi:amino acid transporter
LHPRYRTPTHAILVVGVITLAFTLAGQIGVGVQEAFQLIENVAGILYAFTYLALFAIPIVAVNRLPERPPLWLRAAAISGFAVSLLYSVLSVFPIIDVASWQVFALKIIVTLVIIELLGLGLYLAGRRRSS